MIANINFWPRLRASAFHARSENRMRLWSLCVHDGQPQAKVVAP